MSVTFWLASAPRHKDVDERLLSSSAGFGETTLAMQLLSEVIGIDSPQTPRNVHAITRPRLAAGAEHAVAICWGRG